MRRIGTLPVPAEPRTSPALPVQPNEVKDRLPSIDADCFDFHGPPPVFTSYRGSGAYQLPSPSIGDIRAYRVSTPASVETRIGDLPTND